MEENTSALSATPAVVQCSACYLNVSSEDSFCNNCGYPLKGTEEEKANFQADLSVKEIDLLDYKAKIDKAGKRLYLTAGLLGLGTIMDGIKLKGTPYLMAGIILDLIVCAAFIFLGAWSKRKPFAALVSGISLYGIVIILQVVDDPMNIVRGILIKVFIIACLIDGIRAAIAAEKIQKETHLT